MQFLDARQIADLRSGERAWIAFRDANCTVRPDCKAPNYETMQVLCLLAMTIHRAVELSQIGD